MLARHTAYFNTSPARRTASARFVSNRPKPPKYQHLICHSDCVGFYVPIAFKDVIFDTIEPECPDIGGMVGSSISLLAECLELAKLINLPSGIDPESDQLWKAADGELADGNVRWHRFGVEAFCLARLIRGSELSIKYGAVLMFG
jgi:hypothetical protein